MAEEFQVELKEDVQFRDIIFTLNNIITTLANTCQEDFTNGEETTSTELYPALTVTGSPDSGSGIKVGSANKLTPGFRIYLLSDSDLTITNEQSQTFITGNDDVKFTPKIKAINGTDINNIFTFYTEDEVSKANALKATDVTDKIAGKNIIRADSTSSGVFIEDSSSSTSVPLIACKSEESKWFSSKKNITFTGDVTGSINTDFKPDDDEESFNLSVPLNLGIKVLNLVLPAANETSSSTSDVNKWVPVSDYNQITISNTKTQANINEDSNVTVIPGKDCDDKELHLLQEANLKNGDTGDGTLIIKCYGDIPTVETNIRAIVFGAIEEV